MATKAIYNSSIPVDQPILERPGVMHREDSAPGNARFYSLPPEHPERTQKGDLGFAGLVPSKHSFESRDDAPPFTALRKGK